MGKEQRPEDNPRIFEDGANALDGGAFLDADGNPITAESVELAQLDGIIEQLDRLLASVEVLAAAERGQEAQGSSDDADDADELDEL